MDSHSSSSQSSLLNDQDDKILEIKKEKQPPIPGKEEFKTGDHQIFDEFFNAEEELDPFECPICYSEYDQKGDDH